MKQYFFWQPQRNTRFVNTLGPPLDDEGHPLALYPGADLADNVTANFFVEKVKATSDFIYDLSLLLLVSERAWSVISEFDISGIRSHRATLRAPNGTFMADIKWLSCTLRVDLMDKERSLFKGISLAGLRIDKLVVREDIDIDADLFWEESSGGHVFSERLVSRIKQRGLSGATFTPLQGVKRFF